MNDRRTARSIYEDQSPGGLPWRTSTEKLRTVALATAAIGAIYAAGYGLVSSPSIGGSSPSAVILELTPPAVAGEYRDGTYGASASNEFGGVTVAVTISAGRIARVEITNSSTVYPQAYIDGLPAQVVTGQSADVPVVTGATASWEDFVQATQRALRAAAGLPVGERQGD